MMLQGSIREHDSVQSLVVESLLSEPIDIELVHLLAVLLFIHNDNSDALAVPMKLLKKCAVSTLVAWPKQHCSSCKI